jgi:hypothetical protein
LIIACIASLGVGIWRDIRDYDPDKPVFILNSRTSISWNIILWKD